MTSDKHQMIVDTSKAGTGWLAALIAGMSPSDLAAYLAAFYTFLLICDWFWKKIVRRKLLEWGFLRGGRKDDA